jgi:hypothetical protein
MSSPSATRRLLCSAGRCQVLLCITFPLNFIQHSSEVTFGGFDEVNKMVHIQIHSVVSALKITQINYSYSTKKKKRGNCSVQPTSIHGSSR